MSDVNFVEEDGLCVADVGFEYLFEVENVSDLTWLGDASSRFESFPAVVSNCILSSVCEATEQKIATYQCTCPTFACVTMNNDHIIFIIFQIIINLETKRSQQWNSWTMMISPLGSNNLIIKWFRIILGATHVVNEVVAAMLFFDKFGYFVDIISIPILPTPRRSRKTHCYYPWCNVGQI